MKNNMKTFQENILAKFYEKYVNEDDFRAFARKNKKNKVYAHDFLRDVIRCSFYDIIMNVSLSENCCFYVLVMLGTTFVKENYVDDINFLVKSKVELIEILEVQRNDMVGEELLYANSNTDFWDMIIFDDTYSFLYVVTHEDDVDGSRICFAQKTIRDQSGDQSRGGSVIDGFRPIRGRPIRGRFCD